jgi:signal transduction histidine kinase
VCVVRLRLDEPGILRLDVVDDGRGLPPERRAGVGLNSMRERAAELGGTCTVAAAPAGGTWVCARLPLPMDDQEGGH